MRDFLLQVLNKKTRKFRFAYRTVGWRFVMTLMLIARAIRCYLNILIKKFRSFIYKLNALKVYLVMRHSNKQSQS